MNQFDSAKALWQFFLSGSIGEQKQHFASGPSPVSFTFLPQTQWCRGVRTLLISGPSHFSCAFGEQNGKTWNGALECTFSLLPGASKTVTFALAWYFPNRYVNWDQSGFGIKVRALESCVCVCVCVLVLGSFSVVNPNSRFALPPTKDTRSAFFLGNAYSTYWSSIHDVLTYTQVKSVSVNKNANCARHSFTPDCEMNGKACTIYILIMLRQTLARTRVGLGATFLLLGLCFNVWWCCVFVLLYDRQI